MDFQEIKIIMTVGQELWKIWSTLRNWSTSNAMKYFVFLLTYI